MRRRLIGSVTVAAGGAAVIAGMAALDGRVRDQLTSLFTGREAAVGGILTASMHVRSMLNVAFQLLRDQSVERAPLVIFALAAMVLVLFMLRT